MEYFKTNHQKKSWELYEKYKSSKNTDYPSYCQLIKLPESLSEDSLECYLLERGIQMLQTTACSFSWGGLKEEWRINRSSGSQPKIIYYKTIHNQVISKFVLVTINLLLLHHLFFSLPAVWYSQIRVSIHMNFYPKELSVLCSRNKNPKSYF